MKKKILYLVALFVLTFSLVMSFKFDKEYQKKSNNKEIKKVIKEEKDITKTLREKYNNNDIIGTISIPNSDINEILLQSSDNDYYLKHDVYGNNDIYGSVFLDYRCKKDSKKLLIFGHNDYKEETPFSNLENYYNEDFFKGHQYIEVIIENEKIKYQIFSIYIEAKDFTYMNLNIDENRYNIDLVKYKNKSLYDTNVEVEKNDNILILQTCSNHKDYKNYKDKYLLIIAKKINS